MSKQNKASVEKRYYDSSRTTLPFPAPQSLLNIPPPVQGQGLDKAIRQAQNLHMILVHVTGGKYTL